MAFDTEKIALRPATLEDSRFAYRLKKSALGEYVARVWGWNEDFQLDLHEQGFKAEGTDIIVYDGNDVGLARVEREPDNIYVRHLYVLPAAQSKGIGGYVMRQILEDARQANLPVRLHVLKVNTRAKAFYEKLGFTATQETDTHHRMETSPGRA